MKRGNDIAVDYGLVHQYYNEGNYEQARLYLESYLAKCPFEDRAGLLYQEYSLCLYQLGECAEALAIAEQSLAYYPECHAFYYLRGLIYYQMNLFDESRKSFSRYITFQKNRSDSPNEDKTAECKAYWFLTAIFAHENKWEETLQYLRLFLDKTPSLSSVQKLCALLLQSGMEAQRLVPFIRMNNTITKADKIRLLFALEAYAACLEKINDHGRSKEFYSEWMLCLLHLADYKAIEHARQEISVHIPEDSKLIIYFCLSRWLDKPRQSARDFLLQQDLTSPEAQAALLVENFIVNKTLPPLMNSEDLSTIIMQISMTICLLNDSVLALSIIQKYFSLDKAKAYSKLGRYAFQCGCCRQAKLLLENKADDAEENCMLGIIYSRLGMYEQGIEYFLRAMNMEQGNSVYPCLAFEALAMQAIKVLAQRAPELHGNTIFSQELKRLAAIKQKSKRIRHTIAEHAYSRQAQVRIYGRYDLIAPDDYINEIQQGEDIWKINA